MDAKPGVELHETRDGYTVFQAGQKIGVVQRYANPLHKQNCCLTLSMDAYDKRLSRDLFRQLTQLISQPLQVMADSTDAQLASFLL